MRAPPPVEFACAPGRAWGAVLASLVGLAVAVPLAWALPYAAQWSLSPGAPWAAIGLPPVQGGVALAVAVMTSGAFWLMRRRVDGDGRTLRWDGQDWVLAAGRRPERRGDAALMLDLGPWMLVRFAPSGTRPATWLALTLADDAARWAALRGALWNWRAGRGDERR